MLTKCMGRFEEGEYCSPLESRLVLEERHEVHVTTHPTPAQVTTSDRATKVKRKDCSSNSEDDVEVRNETWKMNKRTTPTQTDIAVGVANVEVHLATKIMSKAPFLDPTSLAVAGRHARDKIAGGQGTTADTTTVM